MPIPDVVVRFVTAGLPDVGRGIATLSQQMERLERQATAGAQAGSRARVKTALTEQQQREKAHKALVKEMEKEEARSNREKAREQKRANRESIAEDKKAAREKEQLERYSMNLRRRSAEMAGRIAARQAAEEIRAAEKASAAWGRVGRRIGGTAMHSIGRVGAGIAGAASAAVGIGGGAMLADAVRRQMSAEKSAALLINQVTTGATPPAGATVSNILGQASMVSKETGMSKEDLIEGTRAYARTAKGGDFAGAMANMSFFAKMAQTTGTDMSEIAGAAGMLQSQNAALGKDPKKMQQMLLDLYAQTKSGSLGMTQIIGMAGRMGSVRGFHAGDETVNQRKLLALGQLVAPETDPMESGTMVADVMLEASKSKAGKELRAMGVKYDKSGRFESMEQMIGAVMQGTGGNLGKITELMGLRGSTLFRALAPEYQAAGGGAAGAAAVQAKLASVTGSTMSTGDLESQFQQMMATPSARFEKAFDQVITILEDRAEPYLEKFADALPRIMPKVEGFIDEMGRLMDWAAQNPLQGLGELVFALVAKDIVAAEIGPRIGALLGSLLARAGGVAIPGGGAIGGTVGRVAGAVGVAAALGVAYDAALEAKGAQESMANRQALRESTGGANAASALMAKIRSGAPITQADIKAAEGIRSGLQGQLSEQQARAQQSGWGSWYTLGFGAEEKRAAARGEAKNTELALKMLNDALMKAASKVNAMADSVKGDPARHEPIDHRTPRGA